ncbi:MAG TPA: hypothetical protein VFK05_30390, partial [Polyangiaceae bacterium]|nr:hypothetical protein [Polyangiaceae bacterium]
METSDATEASAGVSRLDAKNPWPGPASYDEVWSEFFYGRERETEELLRLVRLSPLTTLYGKSGLGKSSLVQAGLFPRLRKEHFLPVHIRLDFSSNAGDPLDQVLRRVVDELVRVHAEHPKPREGETLWEYLHRSPLELWSEENFPLKLVLVFDQFEELFSRAASAELIAHTFNGLADLIENRIPTELAAEDAAAKRAGLDLLGRSYRVLLSFREDFLPQIKGWEAKVPSLLRNYLRLEAMKRDEATKVVEGPGKQVVKAGVTAAILDLVAHDPDAGDAKIGSSDEGFEPVLLSLCCARLNARRGDRLIDEALVDAEGRGILEAFYREALADEEVSGLPDVARFIEERLIQGDRFRGDYPKDEALKAGLITARQLTALTDRHRLLRVVPRPDTARVELIHDRLVAVVRQVRDTRLRAEEVARGEQEREREHREELERREKELAEALRQRERRRKRQILWAGVLAGVLLLIVAIALPLLLEARRAEANARLAAARAEQLLDRAAKVDIVAARERLARRDDALAFLARALDYRPSARAAAEQGTVCLWDRMSSALVTVVAHAGPVQSAVFSPDGMRVLTAADTTARIWDASTGKSLAELKGHSDLVLSAVFSPDGTRVLTASQDNTARIWDASTGKSLAELKGHSGMVWSAVFSPDGARVLTAADTTARIWDASTGKSLAELQDSATVWRAVFSPDGARVLTLSDDNTARIWEAATGKSLVELNGHSKRVLSAVFSPDGARVLTRSEDNTARIWEASTGKSLAELKGHLDRVLSAVFSPDGARVLTASDDNTARIWEASTGKSPAELKGHSEAVCSAVFSPDGARVLTASFDETARIWDASTGKSLAELKGHSGPVWSAVFSPDGARVVTASVDKT